MKINNENAREAVRAIKANTEVLIDTYCETQTPADTIKELVKRLGYENAKITVAELVNVIGEWDGRISCRNREWARNIENAARGDEMQSRGIYAPSRIHPAHIDQIADYMRKYDE